MPEVVTPAAFNERFTIYLNAEGKPVQRTLREMTADEVLLALKWSDEEEERLQTAADRLTAAALPLVERQPGTITAAERMTLKAAIAA